MRVGLEIRVLGIGVVEIGVGVRLEIGVVEVGVGVRLEVGVGVRLEIEVGVRLEVGEGGPMWDGLVEWPPVVYELGTDQRQWRWNPVPQCRNSMSLITDDVMGVMRCGMAEMGSRLDRG